jgi:hypothetical protein
MLNQRKTSFPACCPAQKISEFFPNYNSHCIFISRELLYFCQFLWQSELAQPNAININRISMFCLLQFPINKSIDNRNLVSLAQRQLLVPGPLEVVEGHEHVRGVAVPCILARLQRHNSSRGGGGGWQRRRIGCWPIFGI